MRFTAQMEKTLEQAEQNAKLADRPDGPKMALDVAKLVYVGLQAWTPMFELLTEWTARPEVQAGIRRCRRGLAEMSARVKAFDAPGYTPYFERRGHTDFSARLHAGAVHHLAKKFYAEAKDHRIALSAFHDLAKRPRWHPALARQVERFRTHCWDADFLDNAFQDAGCPELKQEMLCLVDRIHGGNTSCGPTLLAIVARVAPHAPSPRGRHPRFETVLHQTFLRWEAEHGRPQAYTYGPVPGSTDPECKEDFTDAATAATRTELRCPTFNPIAARRAERKSRDDEQKSRANGQP